MPIPGTILNYALPKPPLLARLAHLAYRLRKPTLATAAALLLYTGTYLALSASGRYEPIGRSLGIFYAWAPAGFVHNYRWKMPLLYFFLPLWYLDTHHWHHTGDEFSGKYPIHEPASMEELTDAWAQ